MMFMATTPMGGAPMASALTGAPGAVLLYALIGAMVWPNGRPGGLFGVRGARAVWAALWLAMAGLWLVEAGGRTGSQRDQCGAIGDELAEQRAGLVREHHQGRRRDHRDHPRRCRPRSVSRSAPNWRPKLFLALAIGLNLLYWVVGQGFGGIPQGGATDPNAGLLFTVLAYTLYTLIPYEQRLRRRSHSETRAATGGAHHLTSPPRPDRSRALPEPPERARSPPRWRIAWRLAATNGGDCRQLRARI